MSENSFYLHFRNQPSPEILKLLSETCSYSQQVFETSYQVIVPMSAASFRRLLRFNAPSAEYCLVKSKEFDVITTPDSLP